MLNKIRDHHAKRILWTLLIIILPAFVLWGSMSTISGRKKNIIGNIGDKVITIQEFNRYLKMAQLNFLLTRQEQKNISRIDIENIALDFLVLSWKAKKENITVSDSEVVEYIKRNFSPKGKFDKEIYDNFLKAIARRYNLHLSPRSFEEYVRNFIMIDKLFQKNISVDIKDEEIKEFYLRDTQKAKIAYIFIPYEKFKFTRDIPTKDIEKYYQENKDLFKREPKVNIAYVILNESDVSNENFLKALSRLETIEEIKSKFSLPIKETGLIGLNDPIPEIGWQPQINKIAFSLAKNSLSQVIQTDKGFIILIKKDEQESFVPPLNDIKTEVKERLIANEAREETKHFAEDLANKIIADKINDLKRIAAAEKLDFKETDYFKYNDYIEGLGLNPKVNEIIFLLKKGEIEKLPLLLENGAYIIQLKDLTPFDEKDFTEKKELYAYRLKQNKELIERLQFLARLKNEAGLKVSLPR